MEEIKAVVAGDAVMLGVLSERTTTLTTALRELQNLHATGTKEVTIALREVRDGNQAQSDKLYLAIKEHMMDDKLCFERHSERINLLEERHSERINELENWRSNVTGRAASLVMAFGVFTALLGWMLNKFF